MNDNDIIKALEMLLDKIRAYECENVSISKEVIENTLDLINRLERESNSYRNKAQTQKGELARLNKQVAEQKAEIERLKSIVNAELDTIHDLGDDYERALEEEQELVKTAKSEAIKEFAERLKENMQWGDIVTCATHAIIDNLVKEMTEGKE